MSFQRLRRTLQAGFASKRLMASAAVATVAACGFIVSASDGRFRFGEGLMMKEIYAQDLSSAYFNTADLNDLELIKVQIINRHGARTPLTTLPNFVDTKPWECLSFDSKITPGSEEMASFSAIFESDGVDLIGNCMKGQLTKEGAMQMKEVGKSLGDKYLALLFGDLSKEEMVNRIYVRSSDIRSRRTEYSAMYLLMGMLGDVDQYPTIHMFEETRENLYGHFKLCAKLGNIVSKKFKQVNEENDRDEVMIDIRNRLEDLFRGSEDGDNEKNNSQLPHDKGLLETNTLKRKVKDFPQWESINNALVGMIYHGHDLPPNITKEDVAYITKRTGKIGETVFEGQEALTLTIGRFLTQLVDSMNRSARKYANQELDNRKLEVYLGHDTTLIPLLMTMNLYSGEWPPFASTLSVELYANKKNRDQRFVKLVYNNNVLMMPSNTIAQDEKTGLIPFDQFVNMADNYRVNNYEEWKKICKL